MGLGPGQMPPQGVRAFVNELLLRRSRRPPTRWAGESALTRLLRRLRRPGERDS